MRVIFLSGQYQFGIYPNINNIFESQRSGMSEVELKLVIAPDHSTALSNSLTHQTDVKSSFLFGYGERVFALENKVIRRSPYLSEKALQNPKGCKAKAFGKIKLMENVLRILDGQTLKVKRTSTLVDYLQIAQFLQINPLEQLIIEDFQNNFQLYSVFTVLRAAEKIGDQDLEARCWRELSLKNFEQINSDRFELFQCSRSLFERILKEEQKRRSQIKNFQINYVQVSRCIDEYCKIHEPKITPSEIYREVFSQHNAREETASMPARGPTEAMSPVFKKKTIRGRVLTEEKCMHVSSIICDSRLNKSNTSSKISQIKQEITILSERSLMMSQQLKELNSSYSQISVQTSQDDLESKLAEFEKDSLEQQNKIMSLRIRLSEMSEKKNFETQKTASFSSNMWNDSSSHLLRIPLAIDSKRRSHSVDASKTQIPVLDISTDFDIND